tara:strand:- start:671 stop:2104 length:1434 start_codon:yes stop_codon:yes gene_type:complete
MIGQKSFEIGPEEFLRGITTSDFMNDGGFSPVSQAANIFHTPGLLYGSTPTVDQTDDLVDELIASCIDPQIIGSPFRRFFVDNAGQYYSWNTSVLDLIATDGTNPSKYNPPKIDMIAFGLDTIFTTTATTITKLVPSTTTLTDVYFTFAGAVAPSVPHPAIVFENNAYYGNGNTLLRQTDPTATPAVILTLPAEQTIVTLGIDPGTGKMLLSIIDGLDASGNNDRPAQVGYYDGFSNKLSKIVDVDAMVTVFHTTSDNLYVCYGQNFGYWSGSGVQFLRKLTVPLSEAGLVYKHRITNIGNIVYLVEKNAILAYGKLAGGRERVFYYVHTELESGADLTLGLTLLANLGSNVLGFCFINESSVEKFSTMDLSSVASLTESPRWRSKKYTFDRDVTFNGVLIEYGVALPNDDSTVGSLYVFDETQTSTLIGAVSTTESGKYTVELTYPSIETRSLQLSYTFSLQYPIRRFTVFYTPKE